MGCIFVIAIRIYLDDLCTPMADLRLMDGTVTTICWTDVKSRQKFEAGINGYTLVYDERPKISWEKWLV